MYGNKNTQDWWGVGDIDPAIYVRYFVCELKFVVCKFL